MGKLVREGTDNSQVIVGLAGCGRMGLPMARAMRAAGMTVSGFDIRDGDDFGDVPMQFDPAIFARDVEVLFTVVRDEDQTEDLLFRTQCLIAQAPALETLVICSTLPPAYVTGLRARVPGHVNIVDAPMSGAQIAAEEARLTFIVGGDETPVDETMLFFAAMGDHVHVMGGPGAGMTAKVLNNLVAASSVAATRTALSWGKAAGLDTQNLLHVMHDSSGQTWFGSNFGQIEFADQGHDTDNTIGVLAKDVTCAATLRPDGALDALTPALIETIRSLEPFEH